MKIKFNFGVLKNKNVKFIQTKEKETVSYSGIVQKVKEKNGKYTFSFENGNKLEISDTVLAKMLIRVENEEIVFTYKEDNKLLSGLVGFAMTDTYGFPIEITKEILEEDGYQIDMEGYEILKDLQKGLSLGTFKTKDGWVN